MIISKLDFLFRAELDEETLDLWVEEEWLVPGGTADDPAFSEVDIARALLIRDLIGGMGVNHEGVGVVLNLLDQVYGLRRAVTGLRQALRENKGQSAEPDST